MSKVRKVLSGVVILVSLFAVSVTANAQENKSSKKRVVTVNYAFTYEGSATGYNGLFQNTPKEDLVNHPDVSLNLVCKSVKTGNFFLSEFKPSDLIDRPYYRDSTDRNITNSDFHRISFVIDEDDTDFTIEPTTRNYMKDGKLYFDNILEDQITASDGRSYFKRLGTSKAVRCYGPTFRDNYDGQCHKFFNTISLDSPTGSNQGNCLASVLMTEPNNDLAVIKTGSRPKTVDFNQNNTIWITFHLSTGYLWN